MFEEILSRVFIFHPVCNTCLSQRILECMWHYCPKIGLLVLPQLLLVRARQYCRIEIWINHSRKLLMSKFSFEVWLPLVVMLVLYKDFEFGLIWGLAIPCFISLLTKVEIMK